MKSSITTMCSAVAFVAVLSTTSTAHADGLYLGGSLGLPNYRDSVNGIEANSSGASGDLFGGYQFSPYFAIEGGYSELGRISDPTGKVNSHGEFIDAVGLLPVHGPWSLLGSVGYAHLNMNTSNGDESGDGFKLGVGAEYALRDNVTLRAEYVRFEPHVFNDRPDIDQYLLGVRVGF